VRPWPARSEEETVGDNQAGAPRTHIGDNEDPFELGLPSRDRLLVIPRVKKSRDSVTSAQFDVFILGPRDGPAIENTIEATETMRSLVQLTSSIDLSHHTPTG
jgi:hypothetical protein